MKKLKESIVVRKIKPIKLKKNFDIGTFLKMVVWGELTKDGHVAMRPRSYYTRNPQKVVRKLQPEYVTSIYYGGKKIY